MPLSARQNMRSSRQPILALFWILVGWRDCIALEEDPSVNMVAGLARPKLTNEFESYVASVLHILNSRNPDDFSPTEIQRLGDENAWNI